MSPAPSYTVCARAVCAGPDEGVEWCLFIHREEQPIPLAEPGGYTESGKPHHQGEQTDGTVSPGPSELSALEATYNTQEKRIARVCTPTPPCVRIRWGDSEGLPLSPPQEIRAFRLFSSALPAMVELDIRVAQHYKQNHTVIFFRINPLCKTCSPNHGRLESRQPLICLWPEISILAASGSRHN